MSSVLWILKSSKGDLKKRSFTTRETDDERNGRIKQAETRKIRRLSAWNVFQREKMSGHNFTGDEYKRKLKDISAEWKSMSNEDKEPYQVEAEHQQNLLDDLSATPLPAGRQSSSADQNQNVWKNAAKKRSMRRLALNKAAFSSHGVWDLPTQLGDSILASFLYIKFPSYRSKFFLHLPERFAYKSLLGQNLTNIVTFPLL